ncbi:MAG: patatin-like phospholipase family protein [Verrucomicrobia bacterium]|nr:patatin-like phospholipase family protein [Verrucomicrobiota bacterium]
MNAYTDILRQHPIMSRLSGRVLTRLESLCETVLYRKGEYIVHEGDLSNVLYLVTSGRCQAVTALSEGSTRIHRTMRQGDLFGERALFSLDRFWFTVMAISDCEVVKIPVEELRKQLLRNDRLKDALEVQMFNGLRAFGRDPEPGALGRIAVFSSLAEDQGGETIAHRVATLIRQDTGRSVLYVRLVDLDAAPLRLSHWESFKSDMSGREFTETLLHKDTSGVWSLDVGVSKDGEDAAYMSAMLGYASRHVRYVVLHVGPHVSGAVVAESLVQADLPYVLMSQSDEDVYRCNLLARQVRGHPSAGQTKLLPVVCLREDQRARPFDELQSQLGVSVHQFVKDLPPRIEGLADIGHTRCRERATHQLRYLAHEIARCRVGLALSAGGAKGLAHIGVIQVLEEQGIEIDMIAGTSMGGLIGALWAYGISGEEMAQIAKRNKSLIGLMKLIDPAFPPRQGFIRGRVVPRILRDAIGDAYFSDLNRRLYVVTTDLDTLERVVHSSGAVGPVVHASMAIPGVIVPVRLGGRTLVDGGVAEPIPVDVLRELGVEHVIAVNTIPNPEDIKTCRMIDREDRSLYARSPVLNWLSQHANYFHRGNILDVWVKSMHGFETRVAEQACKRADVVLRPTSCDGRWHDFAHPEKYIALGREVAEMQLERIKSIAA